MAIGDTTQAKAVDLLAEAKQAFDGFKAAAAQGPQAQAGPAARCAEALARLVDALWRDFHAGHWTGYGAIDDKAAAAAFRADILRQCRPCLGYCCEIGLGSARLGLKAGIDEDGEPTWQPLEGQPIDAEPAGVLAIALSDGKVADLATTLKRALYCLRLLFVDERLA